MYIDTKTGRISQNREDFFEEVGGDHKEEKLLEDKYYKLGTREKSQCNEFLKKHPEFTSLNGVPNEKRARVFREQIAEELLALRAESDRRAKANEAPLTMAERELVVPTEGVIRSAWRHNATVEVEKEHIRANNQMFNEALGITGQDR